VRRAHPDAAAVHATGPLEVAIEGGTQNMSLSNLTAECLGVSEAECARSMENWARVLVATPNAAAALAPENLRAVLFPTDHEVTRTTVGRPWVGPLTLAYVIDTPDTIGSLGAAGQAQLGLDDDELYGLALANLRRAFDDDLEVLRGAPFSPATPSLRVVRPPDSYGAARLILHERWAPLAAEVRGDLLAAAPARDIALHVDSAAARDLWSIRWLAQEMYRNEPHPIHPAVFKWTPRGWELFDENMTPVGPPPS
jgi:hypothetical protein